MICRQCGTEIADKAIVCYRCGRSTTEPVRPPGGPPARSIWGTLVSIASILVLIVAGLFMGTAATGEMPRVVVWGLAALGVLILGWRLLRRR